MKPEDDQQKEYIGGRAFLSFCQQNKNKCEQYTTFQLTLTFHQLKGRSVRGNSFERLESEPWLAVPVTLSFLSTFCMLLYKIR